MAIVTESSLKEKLEAVERCYEELEVLLSRPETAQEGPNTLQALIPQAGPGFCGDSFLLEIGVCQQGESEEAHPGPFPGGQSLLFSRPGGNPSNSGGHPNISRLRRCL